MNSEAGQAKETQLPIYVAKWIDYSSKFGLGFQLSDSTNGVYFNDRTIMFQKHNSQDLEYFEYDRS